MTFDQPAVPIKLHVTIVSVPLEVCTYLLPSLDATNVMATVQHRGNASDRHRQQVEMGVVHTLAGNTVLPGRRFRLIGVSQKPSARLRRIRPTRSKPRPALPRNSADAPY